MVFDLSELGTINVKLKRYEKAEQLYARALAIVEKAEGPDHPQTAMILNNLAGANLYLGKKELARQQYGRVLAIAEKAFGKDDPAVASFLESMAKVYRNTGLNADAEACEKKAAVIRGTKR